MSASPTSPTFFRQSLFSPRNERYKVAADASSSSAQVFDRFISLAPTIDIEQAGFQMKHYLTRTTVGIAYQNIMLIISVLSSLQYITMTYITNTSLLHAFNRTELAIACLFVFDWCLSFFVADNKRLFLTSFFSMVDLLTVIPIFVIYHIPCPNYYHINSGQDVVIYIMYGFSTTRILRALRILRKLYSIEDPVNRAVGQMATTLAVMILFNAALINFLEASDQPLPFHIWIYFIAISTATVGYGDVSCKSLLGRFAIMGMIAVTLIAIPKMTNELFEVMELQSIYARLSYRAKGKKSQHIVICGDIKSISLQEFFGELFHEDHENDDLNVVILHPEPPSIELVTILRDPFLFNSVLFIQGSALVDKDLERCAVNKATAVFIMANKFSIRADEEDARSILQWLSIKQFSEGSPQTPSFCLQLIRPENQRHLVANGKQHDSSVDDGKVVVVCLNEIKMGILAKAIMFPGTNTFIMNLISSFADNGDDDDAEQEAEEHKRRIKQSAVVTKSTHRGSIFSVAALDRDDDGAPGTTTGSIPAAQKKVPKGEEWLLEYQAGCDWEIYSVPLADVFQGSRFIDVAFIVYERTGITVIGLHVHDKKNNVKRVMLNPSEFVIPREGYSIEALTLAKNKAQADELMSPKQMDELFYSTSFRRANQSSQQSTADSTEAHNSLKKLLTGSQSKTAGGKGKKAIDDGGSTGEPVKKSYWKLLKRSNLLQKKIELDSFQEKLQKMEERHMSVFYYHRTTPISMDDCIINTSVVDEVPHINNHLIIMGKDLTNLYDLIRPLRAKYLGSLKYIVILHPDDIPFDVWRRICYFEAILVVRGSSLEESDIRKAGVFRAHQVVVLADASANERSRSVEGASSTELETLIDSDAIFTYQCVRRLNPHAQIVVEIVRHENIGYLDPKELSRIDNYKFTPQFASGCLFTTSLLDSLVCQAFYSPTIITVINRLISGVDYLDRGDLITQALAEQATAGEEPLLRKSALKSLPTSCLYLISIPENLGKKTYGSLFKLLAREGKVPLGLLRGTFAGLMGPKSNKMPYVFTNPDRECEVFSCDRVFVLSVEALQANKLQVKDWILDIQMHKKLAEMAATDEEASARDLAAIRKEYRYMQKIQRSLCMKFDTIAESMDKKFDSVVAIVASAAAERVALEEEILSKAHVGKGRRQSVFPVEKTKIVQMIVAQWKERVATIDTNAEKDFGEKESKRAEPNRSRASSEDAHDVATVEEQQVIESSQSTNNDSAKDVDLSVPSAIQINSSKLQDDLPVDEPTKVVVCRLTIDPLENENFDPVDAASEIVVNESNNRDAISQEIVSTGHTHDRETPLQPSHFEEFANPESRTSPLFLSRATPMKDELHDDTIKSIPIERESGERVADVLESWEDAIAMPTQSLSQTRFLNHSIPKNIESSVPSTTSMAPSVGNVEQKVNGFTPKSSLSTAGLERVSGPELRGWTGVTPSRSRLLKVRDAVPTENDGSLVLASSMERRDQTIDKVEISANIAALRTFAITTQSEKVGMVAGPTFQSLQMSTSPLNTRRRLRNDPSK